MGFLRQYLQPQRNKTLDANRWETPTVTNPGTLLNPRYEVVPFMREARVSELADLEAWCHAENATGVRLFVGPGGSGKTRLFIEQCRLFSEQQWHAGFLPEQIEEEAIAALLHTDRPTLAILDYAECRPTLFQFLKRISERPADQTVSLRIVLLAREMGDWWQSLLERDETVRHLLIGGLAPALLEPIPLEGPLREQIWRHARDAFADRLGKPAPNIQVDLTDARFGRMLYLHAAALAAVEGLPIHAGSLMRDILSHERHFWIHRYQDQFREDDLDEAEFRFRCSRLVAALTLRGGIATRSSAEILNQAVVGPSQPNFLRFLHALYPGEQKETAQQYLTGLQPDLLGEALVADVLSDAHNSSEDYLDRIFASAPPTEILNGFMVLGRISLDHPQSAYHWLSRVLYFDVPGRARASFQAALALSQQSAYFALGQILAQALEEEGTTELAMEFEARIPHHTVSLRELGVWATQCLLTQLQGQEEIEDNTIEQARLLNNLGNRLSELGRKEDALKAAQEATDIRRQLAQQRPDAFLPYLATSLNNLGNRLSELGRREDALKAAQEATDIYRKRAQQRPDAFLPDLARSLGTLGTCLQANGRIRESVTAFGEGVQALTSAFLALPRAFAPLMGALLSLYFDALKEQGEMPDLEALAPVLEKFERISGEADGGKT